MKEYNNYKKVFGLFFIVLGVIVLSSIIVSATSCWSYTTNSTCSGDSNCLWKSDGWGEWCEELQCWSLWTQNDCGSTAVPGKNCSWQGGAGSYACEETSCWTFTGTSQTACESNPDNH